MAHKFRVKYKEEERSRKTSGFDTETEARDFIHEYVNGVADEETVKVETYLWFPHERPGAGNPRVRRGG
jgi:hypothetical protein